MKENAGAELDFYLLIPYYNNLTGLVRSLQSITYDPAGYALLIIDDGSTKPLLLADLAPHIPAVLPAEIIRLPLNEGIAKALNAGLRWLESKRNFRYIARLDCGDLCVPDRFRRQVEYLDKHPDIDLLGSWCLFKDFESGQAYRYRTPTEQGKITRSMYFRNVFIHPTVMWRSTVQKGTERYPENYPHAEDYGFFYEIISKGKAAILPEALVIAEINLKGISLKFRNEQLASRGSVVRRYGTKGWLRTLGLAKLRMLTFIPYGLLFRVKRLLYGIKFLSII